MMRLGLIVPFYNHEHAIRQTIAGLKPYGLECWLVDDGSDARCGPVLEALASEERSWLRLIRCPVNRGKGIAVLEGFTAAYAAGCTHALQIDADGQHDTADIPKFLARAAELPHAAVLGHPVYDETMPPGRRAAHALTNFMVLLQTGGRHIVDPQCGFRVYPVAPALEVAARADRMAFDIEIAVRLVWAGVPIVNVPTGVRYLARAAGGTSHFRPVRDNVTITLLHTRLLFQSVRWHLGVARRRRLTA